MSVYAFAERDVRSAAAGDRDAFIRLVENHSNVVSSIAFSIVRDPHACEDVTQEVFLTAWRDVKKLRNPSSFLPWLRQITRNQANQWLRDRRIDVTERDADRILAATVDPSLSTPEVLERDEQQRIVDEVIESLPDEAREIITLFYKEGRSVKQVADLLGLREEAVKKRLSRARARIREELLDAFGEVVRRTAPVAAVVTALGASLTVAGPSASAATSASVAKAAGGSTLAKIVAAASGSLLGAALGSLGIWGDVRRNLKRAIDDRERRELKQYGVAATLVVVLAACGFGIAGAMQSAAVLIATQAFFVPTLSVMCMVWRPRIIARRVAAEIARDPSAAKRLRRERIVGIIGLAFGVVASTATVVWALRAANLQ